MDRLREFSIVTLSLPDASRVSEFKAYVVGVHRDVAALQPVEHLEPTSLPETVPDVLMSFAHGTQTVGLKGELRVGARAGDVRFRVTDGVYIPRRRSSRLKLCAPAALTPPGGAEIACQTHDVGPDGALLEGATGVERGQKLVVSVTLPENPDAVCADGIVTGVHDDSLCSVEFTGMQPETRRVLSDFVAEHFRRRLTIVRSLREERHDAWD